ncbi:hypothetical protein LINGRAHAP2_LOCUS8296 [Linum grandiflorum]
MATATVCTPSIRGTKRLLEDYISDDNYNDYPSPFSKKLHFTPPGLERLQAEFPSMEVAVLELALEECGGDIDAAIHHLRRLSVQEEPDSKPDPPTPGMKTDSSSDIGGIQQWAELLVAEMTKAASVDDAKSRAATLLEAVEKAVVEKNKESDGGVTKKVEVLGKENALLKRAVAILHERQKYWKEKAAESVVLRQVVAAYQERLKTLEANNYALSTHLNLALSGGGSISGHCRPDVF